MADIGRWNRLIAIEDTDFGLMLDGGEHGPILAPSKYLPTEAEPGEEFDVFVYLDSEDRLIATTERPFAEVGDFACLEVIGVNERIGAFLDWGLAKDLLLPFAEQLGRVREGQKVVVAIVLDKRSNRIVATQRTNRHLNKKAPTYEDGQAVSLLISEQTPMGYKAIIEHSHLGLLYASDLTSPLKVGETVDGFVRFTRPDGKIDLSLDGDRQETVPNLSEDILEALRNNDGFLEVGDKSSPDQIRRAFGCSKKAFKSALGALYKKRLIEFEGRGIRRV